MNRTEIRTGYNPQGSPDTPYSVEVLWNCSFDNLEQGMAEISWFATEKEQNEYFDAMTAQYKPSKFFISQDTGSVYWIEGEQLYFAPLYRNHTFKVEEGNEVDEELVGDEHIYDPYVAEPNFKTFKDLYAEVRASLKAKE